MGKRLSLTKEFLVERLLKKKQTPTELAVELGVSKATILNHCKKHQLKLREKIDYTNHKVGRLLVLEKSNKSKNGHYLWKCRCECGNICFVKSCSLASKNTQSCGCKRSLDRHLHKNWKGYEQISGWYFNTIVKSAKVRNIHFEVTIEDIWHQYIKQDRKCALTGLELIFCHNAKIKEQTASLDRIDSSKGYTKDNIQWVHKEINKLKMDRNEEQFIYWCELVSKYNKEKSYK